MGAVLEIPAPWFTGLFVQTRFFNPVAPGEVPTPGVVLSFCDLSYHKWLAVLLANVHPAMLCYSAENYDGRSGSGESDGFELAIAKVIARLIGVGVRDLSPRVDAVRRRRRRICAAVAVAMAVAATAGGVFLWQSHHSKLAVAEFVALAACRTWD